jgi:hypothetical protein
VRGRRKDRSEWAVLLVDHHEGYLSWAEYERNQRLIADNAYGKGMMVRGPVRNLRFTQSYLDAISRVEAVGSSRRLLRGFLGSVVVPAVRVSAFTFTGATEH